MSLMCDEKVFEQIPVKKSVKARVSGIYILEVKGLRTNLEGNTGKRSLRSKLQDKLQSVQAKTKEAMEEESKSSSKKKASKKSKS
jgi:CelD/BcsL family acetyltransferase involved in cellulose biosynthesis